MGSDEVERSLALRDVMEYAVKVTREVAMAKQMVSWRSRPILLAVAAVFSVTLAVYSSVARPDFIWGPTSASIAPARREANVRFAMYLVAQRVEVYRQEQGVLPGGLSDLGEAWPGVAYQVVSDTVFELKRTEGGQVFVFRSDQPLKTFLGGSVRLIRRRR